MDKKPKRNRSKNPNLIPGYNSRIRQEYIDMDYLDKLNDEELAWLNKFMGEYNNGSVILDEGRQLDQSKNLHQNPKHKKELFDKNNAQNRDMFGLVKSKVANTKLLNFENSINIVEEHLHGTDNPMSMENAYIDYIDHLEVVKMLEEYDNAMLSFKEDAV